MYESANIARRLWLRDQAMANSAEKVDPTPVEVPAEMVRPPTLKEELQRYVRYYVSRDAESRGLESFEEFNDFEVDDEDPDWSSEYEMSEMQEDSDFGEFVDEVAPKQEDNAKDETGTEEQAQQAPAVEEPPESG